MSSAVGNSDPVEGLASLVDAAQKISASDVEADYLQVIAFFDLTGSTEAALQLGTTAAANASAVFTRLAGLICDEFGGVLVKTLGDGAFASFTDPVQACRAALNLRHATHERLELSMTAGLTSGRPQRLDLGDGQFDLVGDVVNRASRIQSLAFPGQVLIDSTLYTQVRADLRDLTWVAVDETPRAAFAKGIGSLELYELTLVESWNPKRQLATPFRVDPEGRPTLAEKLALIRDAHTEIIEIGIGLTSFARYFTGQKPGEFRDPLREIIRRGVNLKCFALTPDYEPGVAWLNEQGNPDYADEARRARHAIEAEAKYCRNENFNGRVHYYTYERVPEFWCLGADVEDPVDGRMFFASYLPGVARSEMPITQVSLQSSPQLFVKLRQAVREIRAASTEPRHS